MELFLVILGILGLFVLTLALSALVIGLIILRFTSKWWENAEFFDED